MSMCELSSNNNLYFYVLLTGSTPVDLVLVVDTSEISNTTEGVQNEMALKNFLRSFLEGARTGIDTGDVKVALVPFSTHPYEVFRLETTKNTDDMLESITNTAFVSGDRNTADALSIVRTRILARDRPQIPNIVLLITTGGSDRNKGRTIQEADAIKYARTSIFGVGIGVNEEAEEELSEVASKPTAENTFHLSSFYDLEIMKDILFNQIFTSKYSFLDLSLQLSLLAFEFALYRWLF